MNDLEGHELYYVINKNQKGFSKILGAMAVDQCALLNREEKLFDDYRQVDACFFGTPEEAENYKQWVEKRGIINLEVRSIYIPYSDEA